MIPPWKKIRANQLASNLPNLSTIPKWLTHPHFVLPPSLQVAYVLLISFTKTAGKWLRFPSLNGCFKNINRFFIFQIIWKFFPYFWPWNPYALQVLIYVFNLTKSVYFRKLQFPCSLTRKTSCISGEVLVCTLNTSIVASTSRFLLCTETGLPSKAERLSLRINRRHLLCNLFI